MGALALFSYLVNQDLTNQLFAESLQNWKGLIQGDRHGDFGQVFADVSAEEVPKVDAGSVGLHRRKFDAASGVPSRLNYWVNEKSIKHI